MLHSRASRSFATVVTLSLSAMTLAGCGGGFSTLDIQPISEMQHSAHDYGGAGYQSPNYHPYLTGSHATFSGENTLHIGGDYEPRERLQRLFKSEVEGHTISVFFGHSRDGVGVNRLSNYERDLVTQDGRTLYSQDGFFPFRTSPVILVDDDFDFMTPHGLALFGAVKILNDILPPEFQILVAARPVGNFNPQGTISVEVMSPASIQAACSPLAAACASTSHSVLGFTNYAVLRIPDDFEAQELPQAKSIITHELLHALGT